jgi:hypothetical protein
MTGNGAADTFAFGTGSSGGAPSATVFDTITDFTTASDIIDFSASITLVATTTASSGVAALSAGGVATFHADDSTLALRITATEAGINAGSTTATGQAAVFQFGDDAYMFISNGVDGVAAADVLIKLTGVNTALAAFDTITLNGGNATLA